MIKNSFMYIAALVFICAILVNLPKIFKGKTSQKIFSFAPPIVLIYLGLMLLCTANLWDLEATSQVYGAIKNPILYAMLFVMLLRCDLREIIKLGPKMLIGFFSATLSIALGFVVSYAIMHTLLGTDAWQALGALCGSWMGGGGNMLAIQAALDVSETSMAYTLVVDSICATVYIMFLLWAINFHHKFNSWTKADTSVIDAIGASLKEKESQNKNKLSWHSLILMLGAGGSLGEVIASALPIFDKSTWTVLIVTLVGILLAMTPLGKIKGTEEISNILLYIVIALIASRADLGGIGNAPVWLLSGFIILAIHVSIMLIFAKLFKIDIFTCAVASLANIGGTATAPVLAGTYSKALVPVGIIMALLGYVIGTGGGLIVARIMSFWG